MKTVAATIGALQLALVFSILLRPTSAIIVTRPFIAKNLHHTTAVRMAKEEQPLYKEVINAARIDEKCAAHEDPKHRDRLAYVRVCSGSLSSRYVSCAT